MTTKFKVGDRVKLLSDSFKAPKGSYGTVTEVLEYGINVKWDKSYEGSYAPLDIGLVEEDTFFGLSKKEFTEEQLKELASMVASKVAEFKEKNEPKVVKKVIKVTEYGCFHSNPNYNYFKYTGIVTVDVVNGEYDWSTLKGENL